MRRTLYRVAGESLLVEARDARAADVIDARFAEWYLTRDDRGDVVSATVPAPAPAIAASSQGRPAPIPTDWPRFEVAGGGTCYTDGRASYLDIEGSIVAIGTRGGADVEVWIDGAQPIEAPALTRAVSYALSAALRQRRRFELHSGAVVDPATGTGVLIIGPSGSGKSTLTVHLAAAGWPFLTDDVLLLSHESEAVTAWPLRRCFAITPTTLAASRFLQAHATLDGETGDTLECHPLVGEKHAFVPHDVFAAAFTQRCRPRTLVFAELTGERGSRVSRLSLGDAMTRLIRMSPWSCYDQSTAPDHLAVLSALTTQATAYSLRAGRDLLDPDAAVEAIAACARASS